MRTGAPAAAVARERGGPRTPRSDHALLSITALLFAASAAVTILQCASMAAMGGSTMPGGWSMSMAWVRMPGQSWFGAAASFLAMWLGMMPAMMLPSLMPALQRYRAGVGRLDMTLLMGLGYFTVATALGAAIFPCGAAVVALQMRWQFLAQMSPAAAGIVIIVAGLVQLTRWKAQHLACCRSVAAGRVACRTNARHAWRTGLRLGLNCSCCGVPQMAVLLMIGIMDLRAMTLVSAALAAERLLPTGPRIARGLGAVTVCAGLVVLANARNVA